MVNITINDTEAAQTARYIDEKLSNSKTGQATQFLAQFAFSIASDCNTLDLLYGGIGTQSLTLFVIIFLSSHVSFLAGANINFIKTALAVDLMKLLSNPFNNQRAFGTYNGRGVSLDRTERFPRSKYNMLVIQDPTNILRDVSCLFHKGESLWKGFKKAFDMYKREIPANHSYTRFISLINHQRSIELSFFNRYDDIAMLDPLSIPRQHV